MTPITIHVTEQDIEHGLAGDCLTCPVALAMQRITGRAISVGNRSFYDDTSGIDNSFNKRLPEHVTAWIVLFDNTVRGEPFTFELEKWWLDV